MNKNSTTVFSLIVGLMFTFLWGLPRYIEWARGVDGRADFKQVEWDGRIRIQAARDEKESAIILALAAIEEAKGVARVNEIVKEQSKSEETK